MPRIALSYRHSDSQAITERIVDRLIARYGKETILRDIDDSPIGIDFRVHINEALRSANILLVLVGPGWFGILPGGGERIQDESDPVRAAIETALRRRIPIIPVLIGSTRMPNSDQLPPSLKDFAFRNAIRVDTGPDFDYHMDRLIRALDNLLSPAPKPPLGPSRPNVEPPHDLESAPAASVPVAGPPVGAAPEGQGRSRWRIDIPRMSPRVRADTAERPKPDLHKPSSSPDQSAQVNDSVSFGVSHPPAVKNARSIIVEAWIFQRSDDQEAQDKATAKKPGSQFASGGAASIARGTPVTAKLNVPSCKIEPDTQVVVWDGAITSASFIVSPTEPVKDTLTGSCIFTVQGMRIGQVAFQIAAEAAGQEPEFIKAGGIRRAFVSYASRDRLRVLARVQGIQKLSVELFMDVRDLKANDSYPQKLKSQIDASDVLYLFWSRHAQQSAWVDREWRYGFAQKGPDFIDPVPLADPRKVPPPAELAASKHFNDWTLAYIEYEKSLSLTDRLRAWIAGE